MEEEENAVPAVNEENPGEEEDEKPTTGKSEENEEATPLKKEKKEKKGNWKTLEYEPMFYELYPCTHRWQKVHPKGPCPQYKQVRWIPIPMSERLKQLAKPLLRRLLALWLDHGDKLDKSMRERLIKYLTDNFGLTDEFLDQLLDEAKKEKELKAKKDREEEGGKGGGRGRGRGRGGGRGRGRGRGKKGHGKGKRKGGKKGGKKGKKKGKTKGKKKGKQKGGKKGGKKGKKEGKEKVKKEKGGKKTKPKKEKEEKEKKSKGEKEEKSVKKGPQSGLIYKRRKGGKLPLDWPYKMGSNLLLKCIATLSKDPDEDYNSRASEYFDVQSMAILEQFCIYLDMPLPDPDKPTQYGEALVIMALNLSDWIAKYITTPAQAIPDDKVEQYLELRGVKPKMPKGKTKKNEKPKAEKTGKKKGKEDSKIQQPTEPETEIQRNWEELKSPVYVPEKSRISKRTPLEEKQPQQSQTESKLDAAGRNLPVVDIKEEPNDGFPRYSERTLDDVKKEFLEYIVWYNPWEPEFMFSGPHKIPVGVEIYNIWDADSEEIPSDLRALNWTQVSYGFKDGYSFIPSAVPQYYPTLRPLRPLRLEDVEKSGIPMDTLKQNIRFFSPWFLMKKPLKPPTKTEEEENKEEIFMGEYEEDIEDEQYRINKEPPVKDSLWGDAKMKEQIEILGHLVYLMASEPNLTIEYVFQLLEEFCEAVDCAEEDENPSQENRFLNKKRTIILEWCFLEFFGKKFKDYNSRTSYYMRKICSRFAYYIQLLYDHTARVLWELQSQANPPTPIPSRPETPDDPDALRDWDAWLKWLLSVTKTCDDWAGWISDTVNEAERKATKKKFEYIGPDGKKEYLTEREWYQWKNDVQKKVQEYRSYKTKITQESAYYLDKAQTILPVKHRKVDCKKAGESEIYGENEEGEEEEAKSETLLPWDQNNILQDFDEKFNTEDRKESEPMQKDIDTDETEWEDVGEVEE